MANNTTRSLWTLGPNNADLAAPPQNATNKAIDWNLVRLEKCYPYILIILLIAMLLANAVVLTAFIKHRTLRTPFNIYLISLIMADIAQSLFDLPFMIGETFYATWPYGRIACNFSLYGKWIFSAAVRNTHSMISLNRLWALFMPISYKQYHTKVKGNETSHMQLESF